MTTNRKKAPVGCLWMPDAAERIGYAVNTLRRWRALKKGPASFRVGGRVAYRIAVLDAWIDEEEASDPHSNPALDPANAPVEAAA